MESSSLPTFGEVADQYVANREATWCNPKHRDQWRSTLSAAYCSEIRSLPVDMVDTQAILRVLGPIWGRTPETASRLRGRLERIIGAARALGHIHPDKANPARWTDHLVHLLPNPKKIGERGHHAAMPIADLPAFMAQLKRTPGTAAKALAFVILTAARTGEAPGMTWDEVDFDAKSGRSRKSG